jgi:hypothetical protein
MLSEETWTGLSLGQIGMRLKQLVIEVPGKLGEFARICHGLEEDPHFRKARTFGKRRELLPLPKVRVFF